MFQKEGPRQGQSSSQTVIGPSVKVEGELKGVGNLLIEGSVKGTLTTDQDLSIGPKAMVEANISANNVSIAGKVSGEISVSGHLEVKATAIIEGDIRSQTLSVESGAQINGQINMGKGTASQEAAKSQNQK